MIIEKMSKRGDIDLNSSQECVDALKEELRQTMINQELVFRTQVYELHRLYGIQKSLMEEFKWKELGSCNLMKRSLQLNSAPVKTAGCGILVTGRPFPAATGANSMWPRKQNFWEEQQQNLHHKQWHGCHDIASRPLDLRLSADNFINNMDNGIPEKGVIRDSFKAQTRFQCPLHCEKVSEPKNVKLSVSTRGNICRKSEDGKNKCWIPHNAIDLEDPSLSFSANNACPVVPSCSAASGSSQGAKRDLDHGITDCIDIGASCARPLSFGSGLNRQHSETLTTNLFPDNQLSTSSRAFDLDLNTVQVDSSLFSNNSAVLNSFSGLSGVSQRIDLLSSVDPSLASTCSKKSNMDCIAENPFIHQQDGAVVNFSLINSGDKVGESWTEAGAKSKGANASKVEIIDLEIVSGLSFSAGEKPFIHRSEPRNETIGSQPKTLADLSSDEDQMDGTQVKLEGDAENIVLSHSCQRQITAEDFNLSDSCKCDNNADNQSSSIRTMQSGIECGDSNLSTSDETQKASLQSQVEESLLGEPDQRSPDSMESNHQYIVQKERAEVDELVQRAAELLVYISLEKPVNQQDGSMKVASEEELQDEEQNGPQYSCDSYEAIVLKLTESSAEEYSVTSKAFDVSESDQRDFGYRLKRGTRMRDFQKDILPGLSTLSGHEICEDINIMESVIRSREYRKMRSKIGDGGAWSQTRRSRRARTNYGRRYYA